MKTFIGLLTLSFLFILASCSSPKMELEQLQDMTLGYENGVICGIAIGDDYSELKHTLHEEWQHAADEETIDYVKYMKQWDDENYFILSMNLDKNRKVRGLTLTINGKGENKNVIARYKQAVYDEFSAKYSLQKNESWDFIAENGDDCNVAFDTEQYYTSDETMFSFSTINYSPMD